MKTTIYFMAALCAIYLNACSYDDKSTSLDHPVPDIHIDTTGIPRQFSVLLGEELVIEPMVTCDSNPERDFTYEWRISLVTSTSSTSFSEAYKVVGRDEKLRYTADLTPHANSYNLRLYVWDNKSHQLKILIWQVTIMLEDAQGLLVADSNDGVTSELTLVQDTIWTKAFRQSATKPVADPMRIKQDMYGLTNGTRYNGIIKELIFRRNLYQGVTAEFVMGHAGNRIFSLFAADYSTYLQDQDLFYDPNTVIDVKRFWHGVSYATSGGISAYENTDMWNNRGFMRLGRPTPNDSPSIEFRIGRYFVGSWAWAAQSGSPPVYDPDPIFSYGSNLVFYDRLNGRFLYCTANMLETTNPSECVQTADQPFDPRDIKDIELLHANPSRNATDHCFVVKQNGAYKILTMLASNGSARAVIDISDAPNIDRATHFMIVYTQPVLYYAVGNELYSVLFVDGLGTTVVYNKVWSNPDPINGLYFLSSGQSTTALGFVPHTYSRAAITLTTTANQTEGKVWVLPFGTVGTGDIDESKILTYTGFNRISAIQVVGGY